jgi:uncharacterized protein (TIGR03083 family)
VPHHPDPLSVRAAFPDAAEVFLATVSDVPADRWEEPGLGEWTVRELTGHALRSFITLQRLCDTTGGSPAVDSASAYYRAVAQVPDVHVGAAQRGREAGAALGDPVADALEIAEQAMARLVATPDDHVGETFVGPMRLADYLPTRIVELGMHTLDLQAATDQPLLLPAPAASIVLGVLAELTDLPVLLLSMTGRRTLPAGFNVLA